MTDLICYQTLPLWDSTTLPPIWLQPYHTEPGSWAQLKLYKGTLDLALLTERGEVVETLTLNSASQPPRLTPQQWHRVVSFSPDMECQLALYCKPEDYYHKRYQLTPTHSEVLEAAGRIPPGRALDLGCGNGRNVLYLQQQGFSVEGWDRNSDSLNSLQQIINTEELASVQLRQCDLNQVTIEKQYDFILSTVVMMFLQPETIPGLIGQMQQATAPGGHNLIVAAMSTPDYPCPMPFPFTFSRSELLGYYDGWDILKYNENPGALHKTDAQGNRIKLRFATLLARKPA
ncbi:SAM-dependent methyltransferase TehB [Mixta tenebrionis]|uniref:SAM-dependent methyltransferase TehB n=1 Tax=Mixta tenebrionis TaxID=2562439 RepID=A0A506V685_9GAMM|nr:SAM-dependent methyltransferase TehB [Mixta tenebrionis]TPW41414.1 SAM-dependent methyltransferase TehB [Mixta tenebrionis]